MTQRDYTKLDILCMEFDQTLRAIFGSPKTTARPVPGQNLPEEDLTEKERKHAVGLMRVNHTGEVCAQALYQAQGLVSRRHDIREKMQQAALEEGDHLFWCKTRIVELGSHTSYLNPFWYTGSFMIGLTAGMIGDDWSLGFLAETEQQVVQHLEKHMALLPKQDKKSLAIIQQMRTDEAMHRDDAMTAGGKVLPPLIKNLMQALSKVMVKISYWI